MTSIIAQPALPVPHILLYSKTALKHRPARWWATPRNVTQKGPKTTGVAACRELPFVTQTMVR